MGKKFTILNVSDAFLNNCWSFLKAWKVWLSYAFALFLLSTAFANWSHSCKDNLAPFWWCINPDNTYVAFARFVSYFMVVFFLSFSFIYDLYYETLDGGKSGFFALFKITKQKLRFIGFSFGLCLLFFALLGVCLWLIFRAPNPNWLIEFFWFCLVFTCATVAVLILRTSASFGMFLMNGKAPDFKDIFQKTHSRFYVVLITFCLLTYAVNIWLMKTLSWLDVLNMEKSSFFLVLGSEFFSSVAKFLAIASYGAYFLALAQTLETKGNLQKQEVAASIKIEPKKKNARKNNKPTELAAKKNNPRNKNKAQKRGKNA